MGAPLFLVLSSHLFWTSDYPAGVTQEEGHTGGSPSFCGACLNFLSREGFSGPFPSSTVKSNFVLLINSRQREGQESWKDVKNVLLMSGA